MTSGSSVNSPPGIRSEAGSAPSIVWIDYELPPARKIFSDVMSVMIPLSKHYGVPVAPRFVGADVADDAQLLAAVKAVAAQKPAVIVATSAAVAAAVRRVTPTTPVYFMLQSDPVREGLIDPADTQRSITGYTYFVPLDLKAMEIVKRVFVGCRNIGVVADPYWLQGVNMSDDFFAKSKSMALNLVIFTLETEHDIDSLLQDPRAAQVQVWYVPYGQLAFDYGRTITQVLARSPAPAVYARRKFLGFGGLLSIQAIDPAAYTVWSKGILELVGGVPASRIPIMRPKEIEVAANAALVARLERHTRELIAREANVFE